MRTFHCSALPRILRCPASQVPPEIVIESDNVAGRIGQAVHEMLADYINIPANCHNVEFALSGVCNKYQVEADQIAPLFYIGKRIWDEHIQPTLMVIGVEQPLVWPDGAITGTADVLAYIEDSPAAVIVDWKTGSPTADHRDQLIAYGKCALLDSEFERTKIITVWLRDQFFDVEDITPEDIADWEKRLTYAREHPEEYCPGEACTWCPSKYECKARKQLVQTAATDFVGASEDATVPAKLGSLYFHAGILQEALDRYYKAVKATIGASGPIPLGDGRSLGLIDVTQRPISLIPALPVIQEHFGSLEGIAPALKVKKGELTKLVGAQADRGQKGKAIKAFMDSLQEAGAIRETSYQKLSIVKTPALTEGESDATA